MLFETCLDVSLFLKAISLVCVGKREISWDLLKGINCRAFCSVFGRFNNNSKCNIQKIMKYGLVLCPHRLTNSYFSVFFAE